MLIILETSRAEAAHYASLAILQRAEEFARLYGVGNLSHSTMLDLLGIRGDRSQPLRIEGTPRSQPNWIANAWGNSVYNASRLARGVEAAASRIFVVDSVTGVDEE